MSKIYVSSIAIRVIFKKNNITETKWITVPNLSISSKNYVISKVFGISIEILRINPPQWNIYLYYNNSIDEFDDDGVLISMKTNPEVVIANNKRDAYSIINGMCTDQKFHGAGLKRNREDKKPKLCKGGGNNKHQFGEKNFCKICDFVKF